MLFELFRWWYGPGWVQAFRRIGQRTQGVAKAFSIPILLRTLFSPWKRIVTDNAKGLDGKMRALVDNVVSRTVGFTVRAIVLGASVFMIGGSFIFGLILAVAWPAIPLLVVYLAVRTVL